MPLYRVNQPSFVVFESNGRQACLPYGMDQTNLEDITTLTDKHPVFFNTQTEEVIRTERFFGLLHDEGAA